MRLQTKGNSLMLLSIVSSQLESKLSKDKMRVSNDFKVCFDNIYVNYSLVILLLNMNIIASVSVI